MLGAHVFTCARNAEKLAALLDELKGQGLDVGGVVADCAQAEDRQRLVAAASQAFGNRLDVLINNVRGGEH